MEPKKSYKVLVVEDEGLIARDIATRIEALGHEVVAIADNADEAVARAAGAEIVLMDIRLDGPADGIEAAARIRKKYRIPVVFLTAHADRATLERAKLTDPFGYIVKPIAPASLFTTLEVAIYRHQMERQLEKRDAWIEATLSSVADAVVVTDRDGAIQLLNPAAEQLIQMKQSEAKGQMIAKVLPEDPVPMTILKDVPVAINIRIGSTDFEGACSPVKASGEVLGAVLTLRDVKSSRLEQLQFQQFQRVETASSLAANFSEEYRNLIGIIRSKAENLAAQFAGYTPGSQAIEEIRFAAETAAQVTQRLASFAEEPAGLPEILSLNSILRKLSRVIESLAGDRIQVSIIPDRAAGRIYADQRHVERQIMALVTHACSAMPDGGHLRIETSQLEDSVVLSITHTGIPENPETAELSIARYLTPAGNRLRAVFPRWVELEPQTLPASTILLIEPREQVRAQLHNFFEKNGYNLIEAANLDEAAMLIELRDDPVDLIVADEKVEQFRGVRVLRIAHPYTQKSLLDQVKSALGDSSRDRELTFSA